MFNNVGDYHINKLFNELGFKYDFIDNNDLYDYTVKLKIDEIENNVTLKIYECDDKITIIFIFKEINVNQKLIDEYNENHLYKAIINENKELTFEYFYDSNEKEDNYKYLKETILEFINQNKKELKKLV